MWLLARTELQKVSKGAMEPDTFVRMPKSSLHLYKQLGNAFLMKPPLDVNKQSAEEIYLADYQGTSCVAKSYPKAKYPDLLEGVKKYFLKIGGTLTLASERNWYFLSPYYNAGSLDKYIAKNITLTEKQIKVFIQQLGNKLEALHSTGLYHGQLTPSQILINLDEAGEPTYGLCGFGHYIQRDPSFYSDENSTSYLDPTSAMDPSHKCDATSDIWSLGVIAYKLVSGYLPNLKEWLYEGQAQAQAMLKYQPAFGISATLNHFLSCCLISNPQKRILAKEIRDHPLFIPVRESLDPYEIGKELAVGVQTKVCLCTSKEQRNTQFAIKILNPINRMEPHTQVLLLGEITILLKLRRCPYVIKLHDYFEFDGSVHLVLEYCNGGSAQSFLESKLQKPALNSQETRDNIRLISYNLAQALRVLHSMHIMHRDIKPKNILIIEDPETSEILNVKLADFGASRDTERPAHTMAGTTGYIAPELFGPGGYGPKVDVWSFGATLFYFAYGTLPTNVNPKHKLYDAQSVIYPEITTFPVPPSFVTLIKACLSFDPNNRPSFDEILDCPYFKEGDYDVLSSVPTEYATSKVITTTSQWKLLQIEQPGGKRNLVKVFNKTILPVEMQQRAAALHQLIVTRSCPTLLKLQTRFSIDDQLYLVLHDCGSTTLYDYIRSKFPAGCNYKMGVGLCMDVGAALYYLHTRKMTHGHISTHNIYVQKATGQETPNAILADLNELVQLSARAIQETDACWLGVQMMIEAVADPFRGDVIAYAAMVFIIFFGRYPDLAAGLVFPTAPALSPREYKAISGFIQRCMNLDSAYTSICPALFCFQPMHFSVISLLLYGI